MSSTASANDQGLQAALLETRDARQRALDSALELAGSRRAGAVLFIGTNVPGPDKHRPGLTALVQDALRPLHEAIGLEIIASGTDLLGPYRIAFATASPAASKMAAIDTESRTPSSRLLDIDVYRTDACQLGRAALGALPRTCLVCQEPARECILLGRHSPSELLGRVQNLLKPFAPAHRRIPPRVLADTLVQGALLELQTTPKPGLVDRHDSGSHADLTFAAMQASANLLPHYFAEILRCFDQRSPLQDYVQAGIDAEHRMINAIQANAHKGYIFLSGLLLLAVCECEGRPLKLRDTLSALATQFFAHARAPMGTGVRLRHSLGGVREEAERGLPAVFEHGWPRYQEALNSGWSHEEAGFYLMAILMQQVEDTTSIQRCGFQGLSRIRRDGAHLQRILERRQAPLAWLVALNEDYREMGLTMGGVADCMALTFALHLAAES